MKRIAEGVLEERHGLLSISLGEGSGVVCSPILHLLRKLFYEPYTMNTQPGPKTYLLSIFLWLLLASSCQQGPHEAGGQVAIRAMTFNLWHGGDAVGLPRDTTIKYQLEAIRLAGADVVGLQEQTANQSDNQSRARVLADSLGWNCHIIDNSRAIISRFPLSILDTAGVSQAVMMQVDEGIEVVFAVVHLMYTPYEPYDIADGKLLDAQAAEASARDTRLYQVSDLLEELAPFSDYPTILVGDFNEPSYLDWTKQAIKDRGDSLLPFAVRWPATALLAEHGIEDAYRSVHPDVSAKPGYTWTSVEGLWRNPEIHDRIDLILISPKHFSVRSASVVGEESPLSDIVVSPWPSDHRAVVADVALAW